MSDRARPVKHGVCWCCCSLKWLYLFATSHSGIKLQCAVCCREFGCKPGFSRHGNKLNKEKK